MVLILAGGVWRIKRKLATGAALNFPPALIAATRPTAPFDGHVDLVRGLVFRLLAVGTNDLQAPHWWTPGGAPTTRPVNASTRRELLIGIGPAQRVREIAWSITAPRSSDSNVYPDVDVPGVLAKSYGDDAVDMDPYTPVTTRYQRMVFQRPDDAATFGVRASIDDLDWETFAVFTPGGATQAGPMSAEFGPDAGGLARLTIKGDWAWPMRVVFVSDADEASEARKAVALQTPLGRSHRAESKVFRQAEIKAAYVQLCGQQRFEILGLPSDPRPSTRPASLVSEHLRPTVPGLEPLPVVPPAEISPRRFYELRAATTQPTKRPHMPAKP